jgi:hypothetical protein
MKAITASSGSEPSPPATGVPAGVRRQACRAGAPHRLAGGHTMASNKRLRLKIMKATQCRPFVNTLVIRLGNTRRMESHFA